MDNTENKDQPKIDLKSVDGKIVETLADDMARVIEDDKDGLIKKIIHQDEEREAEKINQSPEAQKNKVFVLVGSILLVATLGLLVFVISKQKPASVPIAGTASSLVFTDRSIFLEIGGLTKEKIFETFTNQLKTVDLKPGQLEGIYLTDNKQVVGLKKFIEAIKGNFVLPTGIDGESLISDNFLIGVYNSGGNKEAFILLKGKSMNDIFSSLRTWEGKMYLDLYKMFGLELSKDTEYLLTKDFSDSMVANKNARTLYDKNGRVNLMYVFINDSSVVIAKDMATARELISRLTSSKVKK